MPYWRRLRLLTPFARRSVVGRLSPRRGRVIDERLLIARLLVATALLHWHILRFSPAAAGPRILRRRGRCVAARCRLDLLLWLLPHLLRLLGLFRSGVRAIVTCRRVLSCWLLLLLAALALCGRRLGPRSLRGAGRCALLVSRLLIAAAALFVCP